MRREEVFDTVAAQYAAIRPEYPAELVQRVLGHAADEYIRRLGTHSDHATLPAETREALFADLQACIGRQGGVIEREYATVLWLSRRA